VILFAFYPATTVQGYLAAYQPTLGLTQLQIELLQGYLFWVCRYFVVPPAMFGGPGGAPLGPAAGGLLVKRSVYDWLNGACPTPIHSPSWCMGSRGVCHYERCPRLRVGTLEPHKV